MMKVERVIFVKSVQCAKACPLLIVRIWKSVNCHRQ